MTSKQHIDNPYFRSENNELLINNIPVSRLVDRVGTTPFYVYDRSVIEKKLEELRESFADLVHIHYAVKANPMPALVNYLSSRVDGLDVASGNELRLALDTGINPEKISFAGPAKTESELLMAIASGITINIESKTELERIISITKNHQYTARVALRLNPDWTVKASGMKMGGGPQQFGIDVEQLSELKPLLAQGSINLIGLHIYSGSQNLRAEAICESHNMIFKMANDLMEQLGSSIKHINIGGGFGIPYFPGEKPLDLSPIGNNLKRLVNQYPSVASRQLIIELGRYIVGECGVLVSKVRDIKVSRGETFVMIDGGLHHHLAASGNFGQVIRKNYPVKVLNKFEQVESQVASVVGPLCTPLDLLADKMHFPIIEINDLIGVFQSGAYGYTASPKDFLSHPVPLEVLV